MQIKANGIMLEYEEFGPKNGVPIILIRGLGSQMIHWPDAFVQGFAAHGFRTIIFDNRDIGKSQRCAAANVSGKAEDIIAAVKGGDTLKPAYQLVDMARDVTGLMDALGIARAHIFGISMGGAITQVLVTDFADRVLTACLVMTSARLRGGDLDLLQQVLSYPEDRQQAQDNWVAGHAFWGSHGYPMPEAEIRDQAAQAWDRG